MDEAEFRSAVGDMSQEIRSYCAKLTGSLFDGDDLAQEALATALAKRNLLMDGAPVRPWLFRIAHNKCIDHLRHQRRWQNETFDEETRAGPLINEQDHKLMAKRIVTLPPRQRAMILLREVYSLSMEEISVALSCSVDAVKSGIKRARRSLQEPSATSPGKRLAGPRQVEPIQPAPAEELDLIRHYARLFDRGDWDGLLAIISSEVQLDVSGIYCGLGQDKVVNRYFTNYCRFEFPWCVSAAHLPSGCCALSWRLDRDTPELLGVMRFRIEAGRVVQITDYLHDDYMLSAVQAEVEEAGLWQFLPEATASTDPRSPPAPLPT